MAVVTFSCHNKAYQNAPLGENFYDFLNEELPEFVENYFPVSDKSEERYIAGLSMGGYGALLHGLTNPGTSVVVRQAGIQHSMFYPESCDIAFILAFVRCRIFVA